MCRGGGRVVVWMVGVVAIGVATVASALPEVKIPVQDGTLVLRTANGVKEPALPVFRNGTLIGSATGEAAARFNVIEVYERTRGTQHFPLVWADIISNTYLRQTYQKAEGPGARLGTSIVGSPSFRTRDGLQFLPKVTSAAIRTDGPDLVRNEITARFDAPVVEVTSVRRFLSPVVNRSECRISIRFAARAPIRLDPTARGNDAFRLLTVSSMFSNRLNYDANVLRYEDPSKVVKTVRIGDLTRRDAHLFRPPVAVGSWLELVKEPGSEWFPDSPSIRVDIEGTSGLGHLGVQGYLAGTTITSDDSLSVWLEWIDVPEVVAAGTTFQIDLKVTATPPSRLSPQ
jgi:hypothetical protein